MARIDDILAKSIRFKKEKFNEFLVEVVEASALWKSISPKQRNFWLLEVIEELHQEQNGLCALCGKDIVLGEHEVDHKIPFCYGGGHERNNIQLAHPKCNNKKRAQVNPLDLLRYLEDKYMNR